MIVIKKELDEKDKKILKKLSEGVTVKKIAYDLYDKPKHISYRIRLMKEYYNCSSITQLVTLTLDELEKSHNKQS